MSTLVSLMEAATFLGVSKATLRNWDNEGKLSAIRNKINGYRLYDLDELITIKNNLTNEPMPQTQNDSKNLDSRVVKRIVSKLQSIIRDGDANSNIVTRFDEISKLLFLKLYAEQKQDNIFEIQIFETEEHYLGRLQQVYISSLLENEIHIPENYVKINLSPATFYKCGKELEGINFSNVSCDIKGLAYEDTIKNTFDKNDNQQFFTPYQIVDFMVRIMSDYLDGVVCDPACGTGGFLTKVAELHRNNRIIGFEIDERLSWISTLNLLIHNCNDFETKLLDNGGSLGPGIQDYFNTIDAIITNPPFGSDYTESSILNRFSLGQGKSSRRRGILFIEQAWKLLKNNGYVAIIIDQGVLNSSTNKDVRQFIMQHFRIMGIIELPESAFMPYANVIASILIMQKVSQPVVQDKVFFAKSTKIGRKNNGDDDVTYSNTQKEQLNSDLPEIAAQWHSFIHGQDISNDLCFVTNINNSINNNQDLRIDYSYHHPYRKESQIALNNSKYQLLTLAEICIERNESYIPATDSENPIILFTGLANIEANSGVAIQIPTPTASIKSAVKRYEYDDIIFSKMRPSLRKISLMLFPDGGYTSSECSVLSVRKDTDGNYIIEPKLLAILLRSDFVYGQIMGCVTGIGRPRISSKDLRTIKIPLPPENIRENAIASLNSAILSSEQLKEKANLLMSEAEKIEHDAINNVANIVMGVI